MKENGLYRISQEEDFSIGVMLGYIIKNILCFTYHFLVFSLAGIAVVTLLFDSTRTALFRLLENIRIF